MNKQENAKDFMDFCRRRRLLSAQHKAEKSDNTKFICPLCGGVAVWERSKSNNHIYTRCTDCDFKVME